MVVTIAMVLFYVVAIGELAFRYAIKVKYFKKEYRRGVHSFYYHNVLKLLIISNIGMAFAAPVYIVDRILTRTGVDPVYDNYWIWFAVIAHLISFARLIDVTSGFCDNFFLTDRYIVDYSQITEMRIMSEKISMKGIVYEIWMYKDGLKVGRDRVLEEDFVQLKEIVLSCYK